MRFFGIFLLGLLVLRPVMAQEAGPADTPERPRVGLVLSGGGARGAAHVGVLKVLDEMRVPIDAVAGTSMGAVVGGLYASGMPAEDIVRFISSVDWQDAFRDRPQREELGFRRKQDDRNFLVRYSLGVDRDGFTLPTGLIQGQKLSQLLRNATLPVADVQDFDRLPIPFRALATDLENGDAVVFDSGDLVTAMRASMSAPGVFSPVEVNGRLLVDGGLVDNLPIDMARRMNVDVLIVVDVSFPLYARDELTSPLEVTNQAFAIMVRGRTLEQRATLTARDIVIDPPLGTATSADFSRVPQSLAAGERAARALGEKLAALALDAGSYRNYLAWRNPRGTATPAVGFVRTDENSQAYARMVDAALKDVVGKPLDRDEVGRHLTSLYALDLFESIDYSVLEENGQTGLEFHLRRKSWGPNYVRVGLNLEDDFEGNSRYNAAARFIMTELNRLGAEWLTDLQIGDNPRVYTEFYQPLSIQPRYFVSPRFEFEIRNLELLVDETRIAEYRLRSVEGGVDFGRELSNWGEIRVGLQRGSHSSRVRIGDPELPDQDFESGGFFARFSYDKLDSVYFPRKGQQFFIEWTADRAGFGADQSLDKVEMNWLIARSIDRHTFIFSTDIGSTLDDRATPNDYFTLGGFLNLSGLTTDSVAGPHYGIARLIYYRKIGAGGSGVLDLPAYAGVSLEAGNAWMERELADISDLRKNASVFVGADTLLGPLYLATGFDTDGETAFYLFLGRTF